MRRGRSSRTTASAGAYTRGRWTPSAGTRRMSRWSRPSRSPVGSENVELVRLLVEAYERDDIVAQLAMMDPEIEIVEWPDSPEANTYRGHAGAIRAGETW